jgi:glycosyltransferase involved in cell wall biosynthesis
MNNFEYSLVIPLYNEAQSLQPLWQEIKKEMDGLSKNWQAIFINDGSSDNSLEILQKLSVENGQILIINFNHNRGKANALQAGFNAAEGEIVITLDADLQDDPQEFTNLIDKIKSGFDLVSGYKKDRHDPIHKTIPSFFFNALIRKMSGIKFRDINSGLKAYRKEVIKEINIYGELYRFIPILAADNGYKITEIPVHHRSRKFGKSKYGVSRFVRGLLDLFTVIFLTKFLKRPLHLFGSIGLIFFSIGLVVSIYLTILHIIYGSIVGHDPLLIFGVLLLIAGIQLISTGLIAELITYYNYKGKEIKGQLIKSNKKI